MHLKLFQLRVHLINKKHSTKNQLVHRLILLKGLPLEMPVRHIAPGLFQGHLSRRRGVSYADVPSLGRFGCVGPRKILHTTDGVGSLHVVGHLHLLSRGRVTHQVGDNVLRCTHCCDDVAGLRAGLHLRHG